MNLRGVSHFKIKGLNQEKVLNKLANQTKIFNIKRISKNETEFFVDFRDYKFVKGELVANGFETEVLKHQGVLPLICAMLKHYGILVATFLFVLAYILQGRYIFQYQVVGAQVLDKNEIVCFVKDAFSNKKNKLDTKEVEIEVLKKFDKLSFVSCTIRGQTLVLNVKEKLLPEEIFRQFCPIFAQNNGQIKQIDLISGTPLVKVGDFVRKGDKLVEPYVVDTSGNKRQVKAEANIYAEIYNEADVEHFENYVQRKRTGRKLEQEDVMLFGLKIYSLSKDVKFEKYETEKSEKELTKNIFLPFKLKRTTYYEIEEKIVNEKFEDVKEQIIEKSKQKALSKTNKHDKIIEEYYTIRHLGTTTIVNYCVVSYGLIGGENVC